MRLAIAILAALLCLSARAEDDDYGRVLEKAKKRLERGSLDKRAGAYRLLDPENPRSLPLLREGLQAAHWLQRGSAA